MKKCLWLILLLLALPAAAEENVSIRVTQIAALETAAPEATAEPGNQDPALMEEAVIYTPNTGKASLRERPYEKGKLIKQCKGGTVVEVLEYGKKWTRIKDGKREGYIKTDCLKFYPADREPIAMADLSWRGTTTGGTRINIRNSPDKKSHVIGEWRTGTDVAIFAFEDGWYEVEAFNMHGFVMAEYVTVKAE